MLNCIHKEKSSEVYQVSKIGYNSIDKFKFLFASLPDKNIKSTKIDFYWI